MKKSKYSPEQQKYFNEINSKARLEMKQDVISILEKNGISYKEEFWDDNEPKSIKISDEINNYLIQNWSIKLKNSNYILKFAFYININEMRWKLENQSIILEPKYRKESKPKSIRLFDHYKSWWPHIYEFYDNKITYFIYSDAKYIDFPENIIKKKEKIFGLKIVNKNSFEKWVLQKFGK
ncbi:hypothetical protein ACW95P_01855 [Candidatus Mycoplasma pogonae]